MFIRGAALGIYGLKPPAHVPASRSSAFKRLIRVAYLTSLTTLKIHRISFGALTLTRPSGLYRPLRPVRLNHTYANNSPTPSFNSLKANFHNIIRNFEQQIDSSMKSGDFQTVVPRIRWLVDQLKVEGSMSEKMVLEIAISLANQGYLNESIHLLKGYYEKLCQLPSSHPFLKQETCLELALLFTRAGDYRQAYSLITPWVQEFKIASMLASDGRLKELQESGDKDVLLSNKAVALFHDLEQKLNG